MSYNKECEKTVNEIKERENELSRLLEKFSNKDILGLSLDLFIKAWPK